MTSSVKQTALLLLKPLILGYFVMCSVVAMAAIKSGVYDADGLDGAIVAGAIFAAMSFFFSWKASRRATVAAESESPPVSS